MKILMVCLGNICRSPIAHGILEDRIKKLNLVWEVDSAGTSGWHDGEGPDARAVKISKQKGIDISRQISRRITDADLEYYDKILVMDSSNFQNVLQLCKTDLHKAKVQLIMNYKHPGRNMAVPDPYYDGRFEEVFDLLNNAMDDVIQSLV